MGLVSQLGIPILSDRESGQRERSLPRVSAAQQPQIVGTRMDTGPTGQCQRLSAHQDLTKLNLVKHYGSSRLRCLGLAVGLQAQPTAEF